MRIAAGPERLRLRRMTGLDVPHALQRILALGHRELLGTLPGLAAVDRALHRRAVDEVVCGRMEEAVTRITRGVEDLPAREERPLELPGAAGFVAAE